MSDLTRIEERVKALFAQAEGAGVTEEEAEAFRDRAYALLAKYALDEARLRGTSPLTADDVTGLYVPMPDGIYGRELQALLGGLGRVFGVQALDYLDNTGCWLYGLPESIAQVMTLFDLIHPQMIGASEAAGHTVTPLPGFVMIDLGWGDFNAKVEVEHDDKWKRSFATGYRVRIHERVQEQFIEAEQNEEETGESSGVLVLKSDLDRANEKIREEFGDITGQRDQEEYSQAAVLRGHMEAENANIGATQIDNRKFLG